MKKIFLNGFIAASLALVMGCSKTEVTSQTEKGSDDSKKIEVEYSYKQKPELVAKLKSELAEVNEEIKRMGEKLASSTEKGADQAKAKLEQLKEKSQNLDVQINKTENATEATWEDVKAGSKKALEEVKQGFNEARDWVSNKLSN